MKRLILVMMVLMSLVFLGCGGGSGDSSSEDSASAVQTPEGNASIQSNASSAGESGDNGTLPPATGEVNACTHNSNCTGLQYCVNGQCATLASLNNQNCEKKCTLKEVEVYTSDKETYNLPPGQGSYTAAGALEWDILRIPSYCPTQKLIIPIKVTTKNYGKVYSDEVLGLEKGKISKVIKHPIVKDIAFTLQVKTLKEECQ